MSAEVITYPEPFGRELAEHSNDRVSTLGRTAAIVTPFRISVSTEDNQVDAREGALTLTAKGVSTTFEAPAEGKQRKDIAVVEASGVHDWDATVNLRNLVGAEDTARMSVSVSVDTRADRQPASRTVLSVNWRGAELHAPAAWLNSLSAEPFYLGDIVVDMPNLQLYLDTSKVVSYKPDDIFDRPGGDPNPPPIPPSEIVIEAHIPWCGLPTGGFTTGTPDIETDSGNGDGDGLEVKGISFLWPARHMVITVNEGESVYQAMCRESLGILDPILGGGIDHDAITVESPEWAQNLYFYRDRANDSAPAKEFPVVACMVLGRSHAYLEDDIANGRSSYIFAEKVRDTAWPNGGEVFDWVGASLYRKARPDTAADAETKEEYWTHLQYKGAIKAMTPAPDYREEALWVLNNATDEAGNTLTKEGASSYGYMLPTGRSTFLENKDWWFGDPEEVPGITYYEYKTWDGMFTAWAESAYRQSGGTVGAYPSEPHWEFVKHEGGWEQWEIRPSIHASNGSHRRDLSSATGYYFTNSEELVLPTYYQVPVYALDYVWYLWHEYAAWTVSPCFQVKHQDGTQTPAEFTIYTDRTDNISNRTPVYAARTQSDGSVEYEEIGNVLDYDPNAGPSARSFNPHKDKFPDFEGMGQLHPAVKPDDTTCPECQVNI